MHDSQQVGGIMDAQLQDARLTLVHRYWASRCGRHSCPTRRDIDPRDLKPVLPFLFILERVQPPGFRVRLMGTALVGLFGRDLTGTSLADAFPRAAAAEIDGRLEAVINGRAPSAWQGIVLRAAGHEPVEAQSLHLPFSSDGTQVDRVLGVMVYGPLTSRAAAPAFLRWAS